MSSSLSTGGFLPASPRVLGVVGLGLIGTSVALAARRRWPGLRVIGIDRPSVLLHSHVTGALDIASPDLPALAGADLIVLATPVDAIQATIPQLAAMTPHAGLVIDTGSTKRDIMRAAVAAGLHVFVGGHPMAGAARAGADLARADLFDDQRWFVVDGPEPERSPDAEAFVAALGARPERVDAETHDAVMAAVSHLPQVVASVLMTVVAEAAGETRLAWSGGGLRDTTRLASSAPEMWMSLLASNADRIAPLLREVATRLHGVADGLRDAPAIERTFRDANAARTQLEQAKS